MFCNLLIHVQMKLRHIESINAFIGNKVALGCSNYNVVQIKEANKEWEERYHKRTLHCSISTCYAHFLSFRLILHRLLVFRFKNLILNHNLLIRHFELLFYSN